MKDIRGPRSIGFFPVQKFFPISRPSERRINGGDIQGRVGISGKKKGGNLSSSSVGRSNPVLSVENEEEMLLS